MLTQAEHERAARAQRNDRNCLILKLPCELRNWIYGYVMERKSYIQHEIVVERGYLSEAQPKILQVCRGLRIDTLPMFYGSLTFHLDFCNTGVTRREEIIGWVGALPNDALSMLRNLQVVIHHECGDTPGSQAKFALAAAHSSDFDVTQSSKGVMVIHIRMAAGESVRGSGVFEEILCRRCDEMHDARQKEMLERPVKSIMSRMDSDKGNAAYRGRILELTRCASKKSPHK